MKYQVIARKFRPQIFEEVVGQKPIVQTLKNAIEMDRTGHAYLFCGPRGVGKTTTARLLAKALNCAKGPTATPCNECASCNEISGGSSIDVLEIDAASNTGVDSIRELRENARYAPSRDRFKIFIVDEVHMLSTSAFNALLKILEEPPEHIAFIMATTERHKLPATILSRCQQFVFRTISPQEIKEHLGMIAEREGVTIGDGALNYVVRAAEGSMRDAQSLLDQIIAFGGQKIADSDVRDVLGAIPTELLDRSVNALIQRNSIALIEVVEVVVDQGLNLQQFVREFLARIRDLLLSKLGIEDKILGSPDDRASIAAQSEGFSEQDLIRFFDMLLKLENDLRWTSEPRFHLEIGCVKLARVGKLRDIEDVIREIRSGASAVGAEPERATEPGAERRPERAPAAIAASAPTVKAPPAPAVIAAPAPPSPAVEAVKEAEDAPPPEPPEPPVSESLPSEVLPPEPLGSEPPPPEPTEPPEPARPAAASTTGGASAPVPDSVRESAVNEPLIQSFLKVFRGDIAHVKEADGTSDAPSDGNEPKEPFD